jgi:hypothetical protein
VPLYLSVVLWADRVEPEPPLLLGALFAWGACVAFTLSYTLNTAGTLFIDERLGPAVPLLGLLAGARERLDGLIDGVVHAAMIGLGFATTENVLYYGRAASAGFPMRWTRSSCAASGTPSPIRCSPRRRAWARAMRPRRGDAAAGPRRCSGWRSRSGSHRASACVSNCGRRHRGTVRTSATCSIA